MCILCELRKAPADPSADIQPTPLQDGRDWNTPQIRYAIKLLGKERVVNDLTENPEESLLTSIKVAAKLASDVLNEGQKQGLSYDQFLVLEEQAEPKLEQTTTPHTAPEFLAQAKAHMEDRAATYDNPEGERSMGKTIEAFNAITGKNLTETDGWLLMTLLKAVRANQGEFKSDNYEDLTAYAALLGESAVKAQKV